MRQLFIDFKKAYDSVSSVVLYNTLLMFGTTVTLVRGINMCPMETCSRVRVGKRLSEMFRIKSGLKQGDALSSLLFNVALECVIWRVSAIQNGFK